MVVIQNEAPVDISESKFQKVDPLIVGAFISLLFEIRTLQN